MKLRAYGNDARAFREAVEPFLLRDEATHSVPIGVCATLVREPDRYPEAYLWCVEDEAGDVAGLAWLTPPHPLGLTSMPAGAVESLVDAAGRIASPPTRVHGPREVAGRFRDLWCAARGVTVRHTILLRMFQAQAANLPFPVSGSMRPVGEGDRELLIEWQEAFCMECGLAGTREELERSVDFVIRNRARFFWEDDGCPVAMAGANVATTSSFVRIGSVYTPPTLRGRGYATGLVTALTRELLGRGLGCLLYTDESNSTSNGIYQRIGYRPIGESMECEFG